MAELRPRQFTKIYLGTDHAGFVLKEELKQWLLSEGFTVEDVGAYEHEPEDDYPDFVSKAAQAVGDSVTKNDLSVGAIIFGGSGQGEAMAANRVVGVRAAVYYGKDTTIPTLSRLHNDANVLSLGARFVSSDEAKAVVWEWLHTPVLSDVKYARRNQKLDNK